MKNLELVTSTTWVSLLMMMGQAIKLKSSGTYEVPVSKALLEQLVQVNSVPIKSTITDDSLIESLEWKSYPNNKLFRSSVITDLLQKIPMFNHHYDSRYPNAPKVAVNYNKAKQNLARKNFQYLFEGNVHKK